MINRIKLFIFVASITFLALSVFPAFAQVVPITGPCGFDPDTPCTGGETEQSVYDFIEPFINMAFFLIGIFAVIFLTYAGFKYVTSTGDEAEAKKAKAQIAYAIIGIIVALGAWTIAGAIIRVGTGTSGETGSTLISNYLYPFWQMGTFLIGIFAVIFLTYAGFKYITSQGQEEQAKQAKAQIAYAIIGIIVALISGTLAGAIWSVGQSGSSPATAAGAIATFIMPVISLAVYLAGIFAVIFLIYAGFKYISSQGQEEQAKQAKAQITYAIVGLAVVILSVVIVTAISGRLNISYPYGQPEGTYTSGDLVAGIYNVVETLLYLVGIFAAIFIIVAGVKYITSGGDEEAARTAKRQITYAVIGLIVVFTSAALINYTFQNVSIAGTVTPFLGTSADLIDSIVRIVNTFLTLVGIFAAIFIIVAGVKYIASGGDEEAVRSAKRQLIYAILGLAVVIISSALVNLVFPESTPIFAGTATNVEDAIYTIVNTFLTLVGIFAAIFIIVAGVKYITSGGDEEAARTAKRQITYALIGLVVVILSAVLVNIIISPFTGSG